jgi:vacuolar protein sorting-associated protein 16
MNPFDDTYQDKNPFSSSNEVTLNPFDDEGIAATSTNPAVDDNYFGVATTNTSVDVEDDLDDVDNNDQQQQQLDANFSAEASWQYLGDLPYRRIPIYTNVRWETTMTANMNHRRSKNLPSRTNSSQQHQHYGLASFPSRSLLMQSSKFAHNNFSNPRMMLSKTTVTKCVGCPNGGPIAVLTLPITSSGNTTSQGNKTADTNNMSTVPIRILTVSGKLLSIIDFPPQDTSHDNDTMNGPRYSPTDIITIGFTNRCILIVVMKDSYCYTFDLRGESILPPFYILENLSVATSVGGFDIQAAQVFESGVAVLGMNKDSVLVELFDNHDTDLEYLSSIHRSARCITQKSSSTNRNNNTVPDHHVWIKNQNMDGLPPNYAIVTYLPTAIHAASNACHYCAIAVLPRTRTLYRHPEIFLSTNDHSVIIVNTMTLRCTDVDCRARISSPIVDMSFAPNGRFLACFTESSILTVISASFETKVLDFDTSEGSNSPPLELKWCGEDSVVLHWKNLGILMVGPYGDWLRFPYEGMDNVFLLPEIDSCRVITDNSVEILQRVPPTTAQLLRIGSIDTAAMLLDASDAYHSNSPSSNDTARAIIDTGMLDEAIEACIDAAIKEFDIVTQKRLLRAASFGMHFSYKTIEGKVLIGGPTNGVDSASADSCRILPTKSTKKFVEAARSIRILNTLRHPDVGFVITAAQLEAMTPSGVVARLVAMQRPALASAISSYLRLPKSVQLYARACVAAAFIEAAPTHLSDSEIAERAIRIINGTAINCGPSQQDGMTSSTGNTNRGGYATVAMLANKVGRPGVANLLLMLESSVADKVPALISTGSYADALAVATTAR